MQWKQAAFFSHKCLTAALPRPKPNCVLLKEYMTKEYNRPSLQQPKIPGGNSGFPSRVIFVPRPPILPSVVCLSPNHGETAGWACPLKSLELFGPDYSKVNRSIWGPLKGYKKWSWTRPAHVLAAAAQGTFMRAWGPAALVRPQNMGVMPQKATQKAPPCALCTPDTLMYSMWACKYCTYSRYSTLGCSVFTAGFPFPLPRPMASRKDRTKGLP